MVYAVVAAWLVPAAIVVLTWDRIGTDRGWRGFVLVLTLALSLLHQLLFSTVTEDALVSFRYATNIADGAGPVFNPGERVEGYTNFLWLVLIALPRAAFGADVRTTAVVFGVAAALACVLVAHLLVNRLVGGTRPALGVAAAVLTASAGGLAVYGPSGSEVPLFVLLVLSVGYALAARRPVVAGVLVAFAVLTRPEGLVVAVFCGLWLAVAALKRQHSWWAPVGYALGALVFLVPRLAWRVTYYQQYLPAQLAARFGGPLGDRVAAGWTYLAGFALAHQGFLVLGLVGAVLVARRGPTGPVRLLFATALGLTAAAVFAGGDAGPAWRLLAVVPPLLVVAAVAAYGLRAEPDGEAPRLVPVAAGGLAGIAVLVSVFSPEVLDAVRDEHARGTELAEIGGWLGANLPAGSVVSAARPGALAAGGGQLPIVDVLGRTDDHIAREGQHERGFATDYDYVVNVRRPAVAVPSAGYTDDQHCAIDPVYAGRYEVATFRRVGTPHWVAVYPRTEQARAIVDDLGRDPGFRYVPCPS